MRALLNMDHIASDKLGNFIRLGIILEVHSTYAVRFSSANYHTSKNVQRTLDDVCDSRARVVCGDGHADGNLTDTCQ